MASLSEDGQDICDSEIDEISTISDNGQDVLKYPNSKPFDTTFSTKTWREDMSLVVQGKHLYVASNILSLMSPVFNTMFEEAFGDDRPREIELKEKRYHDVVTFLRCLYPNIQQDIDLDNVFVVLPLAVEFDTESLKERCNTFLLSQLKHNTKSEELCRYIIKVSSYDLPEVKEKCIVLLLGKGYKEVLTAENKCRLPLDAKIEIQNRMIYHLGKDNTYYETILRKVDIKKVWFEDSQKKIENFKNGSVGCLEYFYSGYMTTLPAESAAVSVHGIDWHIGVRKGKYYDEVSIYLITKLPKQRNSWSCRAYAKLYRNFELENSKPIYKSEINCIFTETKRECQFERCVDIDNVKSFEIRFFAEEPTLKIDQ